MAFKNDSMNNGLVVDIKHLSKAYKNIEALKDVNLKISQGVIYGLLGPNGSGKSTLLKILVGLIAPTEGSIKILGYDIENNLDLIRENIGVVFDTPALYEYMTVYENLELFCKICRIPKGERFARIYELGICFSIIDKMDTYVSTLSKGTKQKVSIVRALLHKPKLLFLDEPTIGLDPLAIVTLRNYLHELTKDQNVTIFINTHDLSFGELICDQVGIIKDGQLFHEGNPIEFLKSNGIIKLSVRDLAREPLIVISREYTPYIRIDEDSSGIIISINDSSKLNDILHFIISNGGHIETIDKEGVSLERLFY